MSIATQSRAVATKACAQCGSAERRNATKCTACATPFPRPPRRIAIRMSRSWSGQPIVEHRTLEIDTPHAHIRCWLRPFTKPYAFWNYGPLCFGFAWISFSIFSLQRSAR
jgi:hypothetical protein